MSGFYRLERTKNVKRNVLFGLLQRCVSLLLPFAVRTVLIYQAERIWYTDRVLYYYRLREGSITHDKSREMFRESFSMGIDQLNGLRDFGYPVEKQDSAMQNRSMGYCIKMGEDDEDEYSVHAQNWLDGIEGIPRIFTWKRKVLLVVYRFSPRLFDLICIVFRRRLRK